jgi:hypothetical protein
MRIVEVGEGDDGRSKVATITEVFGGDSHGHAVLWETHQSPPEISVPPRNAGGRGVEVHDVAEPGGVRWYMVSRRSGEDSGMHRTDALNYVFIFLGAMTLELEDGDLALSPGDAVMIPGVAHNWRPGPDGCTYSVVMHGLARPA